MTSRAEAGKGSLPWMRYVRTAFIAATICAALVFLANQQEEIAAALDRANTNALLSALVFSCANALFACWSWYALTWSFKPRVKLGPAMGLFFTSQLGKYLPGGIWPFLAAAELGHGKGLPRAATVGSFTLALLVGLATGVIAASAAGPSLAGHPEIDMRWAWLAAAPILLILVPRVRAFLASIAKLEKAPGIGEIMLSSLLALIAWLCAGSQLMLLSAALGTDMGGTMLFAFTGIYAASWVVGFLFMIAPAGFGPREATMIALLTPMMSLGDATLVALLSRVGMTLADFVAAGVVAMAARSLAAR